MTSPTPPPDTCPAPKAVRWWNRFVALLLIVAGSAVSGLPYLFGGRPSAVELGITTALVVLGAYVSDAPDVGKFVLSVLDRLPVPWKRS